VLARVRCGERCQNAACGCGRYWPSLAWSWPSPRLASATALVSLPAPPGAACRVAAAVASGAGTRVARAGTASGLNDVLLAAAAFAALGAVVGFAYGPGPVRQPPPKPGAEPVAPAEHVQRAADPGSAAG